MRPPATDGALAGWRAFLLTALALVGVVTVWTTAPLADASGKVLVVVVPLLFFLDLADVVVRLAVRSGRAGQPGSDPFLRPAAPLGVAPSTPHRRRLHTKPWALIVSVRNLRGELGEVLRAFEPWRDRTWFIDDASTDGTATLLQQAGFQVLASPHNLKKPAALERLLHSLPHDIETVVVMDPDVRIVNDEREDLPSFEHVVYEFQRSGMAACTPAVSVRNDNLLARIQAFEYSLSLFVGRQSLGRTAVCSGVSIYRRDALEWALARHSLSVYAEDLEVSVLLLERGEEIYFDGRFEIETRAKESWRELFSQRVGWGFGLARVYAQRFSEIWRIGRQGPFAAYHFLAMTGVLALLLQPLRVFSLVVVGASLLHGVALLIGLSVPGIVALASPAIFVVTYLQYLALAALGLAFGVRPRERGRLASVVPLYYPYALFQIVPTTVGYLNWVLFRLFGRRIFVDYFDDRLPAQVSGGDARLANGALVNGGHRVE